jgi:hypothetical protein
MFDPLENPQNSAPSPVFIKFGPTFLLYFFILSYCLSFVYVAQFYHGFLKIMDGVDLVTPALNVTPLALISILFTLSRFSFGYFLGFYLYTIVLGFLWLTPYSTFAYDHVTAAVSAFACALAFLIPALSTAKPVRQRLVLSPAMLEWLLRGILVLGAAVIAIGALYGFRLVGLSQIYDFRDQIGYPRLLNYAIGVTSNALLPYAFACFFVRTQIWWATATLLLMALFYPITLSKLALFAPFWLSFLAMLSWCFQARTVVVLSLLLPMLLGVLLAAFFDLNALSFQTIILYFGTVNFRMIALASSALDFYNSFFSIHQLTHFCQINVLKLFVACPYQQPLAVVMQQTYQIGFFNASLFATEGVASVGPVLAPLVSLACGFVIALSNRMSAELPDTFVLLSGGLLSQTFLNVPLTITLGTNGAALLFLLWYITPRTTFERSRP